MKLLTLLFQSYFSSHNCYLLINIPNQEHIRSGAYCKRFALMGDLRKTTPKIEFSKVKFFKEKITFVSHTTGFCHSKHCCEKPFRNNSKRFVSSFTGHHWPNTLGILLFFTSSVFCLRYVQFCCLPGTHQLISHFIPSTDMGRK